MKFLGATILVLLTSFSALAQDNEVTCKVKVNSEIQFDFILASPEGQKIKIGDFEAFRVFLNHTANNQFSLEVFDGDLAMRTYSDAPLRTLNDEITHTIWKRDVLFETTCQLHK
ncbi:hypothetical protein [Bdellovibrio svalbardensis]|uniref:Uncharacterized protein n=1 Tax=Bdellovibrio svalbardensis TaxID=2972972 RepID=A0ABT6DJE3_9BACT|nr:hypothetical protein [Bdellovibrio svalbardensis]MDG0816985.1 hypothetical protein [Bdellovibrio svalbardensis]